MTEPHDSKAVAGHETLAVSQPLTPEDLDEIERNQVRLNSQVNHRPPGGDPILALIAEVRDLRAKVGEARELHQPFGDMSAYCQECSADFAVPWPCATYRALAGES